MEMRRDKKKKPQGIFSLLGTLVILYGVMHLPTATAEITGAGFIGLALGLKPTVTAWIYAALLIIIGIGLSRWKKEFYTASIVLFSLNILLGIFFVSIPLLFDISQGDYFIGNGIREILVPSVLLLFTIRSKYRFK